MSSSITKTLSGPWAFLQRSNRSCLNERRKPFNFWLTRCWLLFGKTRKCSGLPWSRNDEAKETSFNESYHGYRTFSDLLADAEKHGIIRVRTDSRSGTYVVVGFGKEEKKIEAEEPKNRKKRKNGKSRSRAGVRGQENSSPRPPLPFLTRLLLNKLLLKSRLLKQLLLGFQKMGPGTLMTRFNCFFTCKAFVQR